MIYLVAQLQRALEILFNSWLVFRVGSSVGNRATVSIDAASSINTSALLSQGSYGPFALRPVSSSASPSCFTK